MLASVFDMETALLCCSVNSVKFFESLSFYVAAYMWLMCMIRAAVMRHECLVTLSQMPCHGCAAVMLACGITGMRHIEAGVMLCCAEACCTPDAEACCTPDQGLLLQT
jgi:hypothetical protein